MIDGEFGNKRETSGTSDYNTMSFVIQQALNSVQTISLVQVVGVSNDGGITPVGTVDVLPLVNQVTGDNKQVPHGVVYKLPYFRLQGGTNAVIPDPQVGDIGMCAFASRDTSVVRASKKQGPPGILRKFSFSDGLYFGGMLNGTPVQFVRFSAEGVEVTSPNQVTINAPEIVQNGHVTINGQLTQVSPDGASFSHTATAGVDVVAAGISLVNHVHPLPGGGNTLPPI